MAWRTSSRSSSTIEMAAGDDCANSDGAIDRSSFMNQPNRLLASAGETWAPKATEHRAKSALKGVE